MKVLFIALEFAPLNTTGNYRSLKFVKYFKEYGIDPVVLSVDQESGIRLFGNRIDLKLLDEIPENTTVYRFRTKEIPSWVLNNRLFNFLRIYFNTDDKIGQKWTPEVEKKLEAIVQEHAPKAIYISLPPFSGYHIVDLLKRKTGLPLIADMRDLWSQWSTSPWQSRWHYRKVLRKEKRLFKQADKIISVTPQLAQVFQEVHPEISPDKFDIIYNGHDIGVPFPEKIQVADLNTKEKIVIGYIGSFYYNPTANADRKKKWWKRPPHKWLYYSPVEEDWSYRSPLYFIRTLSQLLKRQPDLRSRIVFEHVGRCPDWLLNMLKEYEVEDVFHSHGFVSYEQVLKIQKGFDFFLSTSEKVENKEHYCLPSKTFDYLKEQKPILGFVTPGIQQEFLPQTGLGILFDPDDTEASCLKLGKVLMGDFELSINRDYISSFHRRNLTGQLAAIVQKLSESPTKLSVENV